MATKKAYRIRRDLQEIVRLIEKFDTSGRFRSSPDHYIVHQHFHSVAGIFLATSVIHRP